MKTRYIALFALAALGAACDSPLDTNPTTAIDAETALNTPDAIERAVSGAYRSLQAENIYGRTLPVYPDLYADNLAFTGTYQTDREVQLRSITPTNGGILGAWQSAYAGINRVNNILAAISTVKDMPAERASQFRGEALFIRGLHYLNLVRYFGGVPIVTEPSRGVTEEAQVARSSAQEVYAQIVKDLEEAATLLSPGRRNGVATRGAANALLARTYLEMGAYAKARDKATEVITSKAYSLVPNYRDLFTTKNTSEGIFELQFSVNNQNSHAFFFYPSPQGRYGYAPSEGLRDAFEAGDVRKAASIGVSGTRLYGLKYPRIATSDDNVHVLRLAEMYLIRAEANAQLGAPAAVVLADVNVVRTRAGLAPLDPAKFSTREALLSAILHERRVEFAMEGHRFFDLRRLGRAEQVLNIPANRLLFPIPQAERDVNDNLEQNPGY